MFNSDIEEKVILGLPIETEFGLLKPLSIHDYLQRINSLGAITMGKKKLLAELGKAQQKETGQSDEEIFVLLRELNELPLLALLKEYFSEVLQHYMILTRFCKYFYLDEDKSFNSNEDLDKHALDKSFEFVSGLNEEQFDRYRNILLEMHAQSDAKAHLNPFLEKRAERGRKLLHNNDTNAPSLATMISSCAVYMGLDYSVIAKWNALQLQHSFQRISFFIENSATTLFATVSGDIDFVSWAANIENNKDTNTDQQLDVFTQNLGSQLK